MARFFSLFDRTDMTEGLPLPYEYAHKPIFSPRAQGDFLENLSANGNVRLACRAARVSPQTAYRARRRHAAFALAWDAALLSARSHAEEVLADRALNGVEEAVFYHGEEVATRVRYDSRLLLAHLARLDRLAERAEVNDALTQLDDQIEALQRGETLAEEPSESTPEIADKDTVPCVPSSRIFPPSSSEAVGQQETPSLDARLQAMEEARPHGVPLPHELGDADQVEWLQLEAFEADEAEWWNVS